MRKVGLESAKFCALRLASWLHIIFRLAPRGFCLAVPSVSIKTSNKTFKYSFYLYVRNKEPLALLIRRIGQQQKPILKRCILLPIVFISLDSLENKLKRVITQRLLYYSLLLVSTSTTNYRLPPVGQNVGLLLLVFGLFGKNQNARMPR